jgi:hypothetical protein
LKLVREFLYIAGSYSFYGHIKTSEIEDWIPHCEKIPEQIAGMNNTKSTGKLNSQYECPTTGTIPRAASTCPEATKNLSRV